MEVSLDASNSSWMQLVVLVHKRLSVLHDVMITLLNKECSRSSIGQQSTDRQRILLATVDWTRLNCSDGKASGNESLIWSVMFNRNGIHQVSFWQMSLDVHHVLCLGYTCGLLLIFLRDESATSYSGCDWELQERGSRSLFGGPVTLILCGLRSCFFVRHVSLLFTRVSLLSLLFVCKYCPSSLSFKNKESYNVSTLITMTERQFPLNIFLLSYSNLSTCIVFNTEKCRQTSSRLTDRSPCVSKTDTSSYVRSNRIPSVQSCRGSRLRLFVGIFR